MDAERESLENKRILIVNVNWIGDVLFSSPAIRLIKETYPSCFLACMIVPRCREILENNPFIDELIFFDERLLNVSFFSKWKFIGFLRKKKFDTAFIFHRSFTRALICQLAGIPERIGYGRKKTAFLLTKKIKSPLNVHRVDSFLELLKSKELWTKMREYQFFIKEEDRRFAEQFLKENRIANNDIIVCLNPGGNWDLKRWPSEYFVMLGDSIAEKYKAKILIVGAEKDRELALGIASHMKYKPIVSAGRTSLSQLAALFEKSHVVISADSGPMHIAVSMKTPTIALFGPTSPEITGPIGSSKIKVIQENVGCATPCYKSDCRSNKCMQAITVQRVMDAIEKEKFL